MMFFSNPFLTLALLALSTIVVVGADCNKGLIRSSAAGTPLAPSDSMTKEDAHHLLRHLFATTDLGELHLSLSLSYSTSAPSSNLALVTSSPSRAPVLLPLTASPSKGAVPTLLLAPPTNVSEQPPTVSPKTPVVDSPKKSPVESDSSAASPDTKNFSPGLIATISLLVVAALVVTGLIVYRRTLMTAAPLVVSSDASSVL